MSELKVYKPYANRDGDVLIYHKGDGDLMLDDEDEIYLKEDADKVIAHNKYKRCVAMARMCEAEANKCLTQQGAMIGFLETDRFQYLQWHFTHFSRWHRIWLKLAKQFKEAK